MPSKTEEYLALAQRTANGLTRYWESWTDYLTTAFIIHFWLFQTSWKKTVQTLLQKVFCCQSVL